MLVDKMRKSKINNGTWHRAKSNIETHSHFRRPSRSLYKYSKCQLVSHQTTLCTQTIDNMRTGYVSFAICACLALAAADVSHLASSYLPPPKPEQVEQMTIEQHELRELPEQVDYLRENEQGAMENAPSSQLTPPAMPQAEEMLSTRYLPPAEPAMPAQSYLPPAEPTVASAAPALPTAAAMRYLPPAQAEPEPMMQPEMMQAMEYSAPAEPQPEAAPAMRYLPPVQQAEPNAYQQYQQQEQEQEQEQEQQMPYILDVQQPMAPSDAETLALEPEPAHELRQDGYHYRHAEQEQRLRH
ncbi:predicted GPI-anchored protein 58 [Drosophila navojoa]|nr:predicted GPI-anchored protein 58 [Drosophila navojoa]